MNVLLKISPITLIWLGFYFRLLASLWSVDFGLHLVFTGDVARFHNMAVTLNDNGDILLGRSVLGYGYPYFLSFLYKISMESIFIGAIVSSLAWLLSGFVLIRTLNFFFLTRANFFIVIALFTFLPSSVLNTGVPMRESYLLLFTNLTIYSLLKIYLHKDVRYWLLMSLCICILAIFHPAYLPFGMAVLVLATFSYALRNKRIVNLRNVFIFSPFFLIFLFFIFNTSFSLFSQYAYDLDIDGISGAVSTFRSGSVLTSPGSRAQYQSSVQEIDGVLGLITFLPVSLFQYLFEPMPWKISSLVDIILLIENLIRGILIFFALKALFSKSTPMRRVLFILIILYFFMELIWSLGTTNWGTASRHHVPIFGVLLIIGIAFTNQPNRKYAL